MSGIYIPGMAMPAEQTYVLIIAIQSDGRVFPVRIDAEGNPMIFQNEEMQNRAIPVPPHGRLIDADALVADLKGQVERLFNLDAVSESDFFIERNEKFRQAMWKNWCESFYEYLSARPTVIEAEEVKE